MPVISVLVVEDDPLYRYALEQVVDGCPGLSLTGSCRDGRAALAHLRTARPDVCVMDVRLPLLGGIDVLHALRADDLPSRVLLVSAYFSPQSAYDAIAAGARGCLAKDVDPDGLRAAIEAVAGGEIVLSPRVQVELAAHIRAQPNRDQDPRLTAREQTVLTLAARGLVGREIARVLFVSPSTVKTHFASAYHKLGVTSRGAAIAEAMRLGMLHTERQASGRETEVGARR